ARDTPVRETAAPRPDRPAAGWTGDCLQELDGWQKAARECFYDDGGAVRRYRFEVRRVKRGGVGPVGRSSVYGPWLVGTPGSFVEAKIEDGEFRWRAGGRGDWQSEQLELPKDAPSVFVRVSAAAETATLEIAADARMSDAQRVRVGASGGFGVKKDTQIREFSRR
ncbi:MAG TPA: hypothetical protein VK864_02395, partial [Longimicrobiales bacterium]|nr:hypothetical protein [Longimicrobiales bacterium]